MESESDSVASEDDAGKKEEMKRSIFMKRKSDENKNDSHKRSNPFTFKVGTIKPIGTLFRHHWGSCPVPEPVQAYIYWALADCNSNSV